MKNLVLSISIVFCVSQLYGRVDWKVSFSSSYELKFIVTINKPHKGDLHPVHFLIGLPSEKYPAMNASFQGKSPCPENCNDLTDTGVEWIQKQQLHRLNTATLKVSPYAGQNEYYSKIIITIQFDNQFQGPSGNLSKHQKGLLTVRVLNWETAKDWIVSVSQRQTGDIDQPFSPLLKSLVDEAEYIIIAPQDFESASQPLLDHRSIFGSDPLTTAYVSLEEIYSEFLDDNSEAEAIKLFFEHAINNWSESLTFALLMGDVQFVPTMYGGSGNYTYASDDLLAAIDGNIPAVALGRYPARHVADVEAFVEKIIAYETNPELGLWRNRITLAADDVARPVENDTEHIEYSELLALDYIPPFIDVQKIYLTEYPEVSDASNYGVVKPEATQALFDALDNGTAIINYIGHGSSTNWAQEKLLVKDRGDLQFINTGMKLPIWIAGTCSWGHFDDPNTDAFSEDIIRLPMNGASAIISSSRAIGYTSNWLNEKRLFQAFFPEGNVSDQPIGIIFQAVKTGSTGGQMFHLFGDPAMSIPFPKESATITNLTPDTLATLEIAEFNGNSPFSGGTGYVVLKDSDRNVERSFSYYSGGWQTSEISYTLPGATLFQGEFTFSDNNFSGSLIVPEDISFSQSPGKLSVYATSNDDIPREAVGMYSPVYFTGGSSVQDDEGPSIQIEYNGYTIGSGDTLNPSFDLTFHFEDPVGINIYGEPGHELRYWLDDESNAEVMNGDFVPDSLTHGHVDVSISDTLSGGHHLFIEAWDNANNRTLSDFMICFSDCGEGEGEEDQDIGDWDSFTSPLIIHDLVELDNQILCATKGGLLIYDVTNEEFSTLTNLNGLTGTNLNVIEKDLYGNVWLGGAFQNGFVQVYDLSNSSSISGFDFDLTEIIDFAIADTVAFGLYKHNLDFGIQKFLYDGIRWVHNDLMFSDWLFESEQIAGIVIWQDSVIVATDEGLYGGDINNGPHEWGRLFSEELTNTISSIHLIQDELLIVMDNAPYSIDLNTMEISQIQSSVSLVEFVKNINDELWGIRSDRKALVHLESNLEIPVEYSLNVLIPLINGSLAGGTEAGIVLLNSETQEVQQFIPNAPLTNQFTAVTVLADGRVVAGSKYGLSIKEEWGWRNIIETTTVDVIVHESFNNNFFAADTIPVDFGGYIADLEQGPDGLVYCAIFGTYPEPVRHGGGIIIIDIDNPSNFTLIDTSALDYYVNEYMVVKDLEFDSDGNLWVADTYAWNKFEPVQVRNTAGVWGSYVAEEEGVLSLTTNTITIDEWNRVWIGSFEGYENLVEGIQYPDGGLIMLTYEGDPANPDDFQMIEINVSPGNSNNTVWSLAMTPENRLYALTPLGLTYFDLSSSNEDPVLQQGPSSETGELYYYFPNISFGGPHPNAKLKADHRGNVWATSTTDGIHVKLNNATYWPDINGLRESNSLLLSDGVTDIEFDSENGIAYITTNRGINALVIPDDILNIEDSQIVMLPGDYSLKQNYPNPFNPLTTIQYNLPIKSHVSLVLYDILGRQVRTLVNRYQDIGNKSVRWDSKNKFGKPVSAGVYLYQIRSGEFVQTRKMVLLK